MANSFKVSPPAQTQYRVLSSVRSSSATSDALEALKRARENLVPEAVYVQKQANGWAVTVEGRQRAAHVTATKDEAIAAGKAQAASLDARLVVHNVDGSVASDSKPFGAK